MTERNPNPPYKRIATEEAWAPAEMIELYRKEIEEKAINDPGFQSLWGFFSGDSPKAKAHHARIQDLGEIRLKDMDDSGIDIQVLSLTSPGVQIFDPATATSLATRFNDELAEGIARHPDRFAGLAAFSPLDPANAANLANTSPRSSRIWPPLPMTWPSSAPCARTQSTTIPPIP
mgnify:CR=1 FL=1